MSCSACEAELDGLALEAIVKGVGIEIAGAFVEQRSDQVRGAGFAGRILSRAADEGKIDGDERDRRLAHQPGLDAAGAHHALDGRGASRRGESNKRQRRATAPRRRRERLKAGVMAFTSASPPAAGC